MRVASTRDAPGLTPELLTAMLRSDDPHDLLVVIDNGGFEEPEPEPMTPLKVTGDPLSLRVTTEQPQATDDSVYTLTADAEMPGRVLRGGQVVRHSQAENEAQPSSLPDLGPVPTIKPTNVLGLPKLPERGMSVGDVQRVALALGCSFSHDPASGTALVTHAFGCVQGTLAYVADCLNRRAFT